MSEWKPTPRGSFVYQFKRPKVPTRPLNANPKPYNKAAKEIDEGDTIAELRKAWGIEKKR